MRARHFAYSILDRVEPEPLVFDGRLSTTLVVLLLAGLVAFSGHFGRLLSRASA